MSAHLTWLITGCDSGMGYAIAETALKFGETVVVTARRKENIAPLLAAYPQTAFGHELDVTSASNIRSVVDAALGQTSGIDVLVNNAGYGLLGTAEETLPEEFRPLFEVNFFGTVGVTQALLPHMRERRKGHIINITSSGGYSASAGFAFYAASKFAVEGFSESLALEVRPFNIYVTMLEPGSFRTKFAGASLQRTKNQIAAYAEGPAAVTYARMAARDGAQPDDPNRLAQVLVKISRDPEPPLRLPLGQDGLDRVIRRINADSAIFERLRPLILSTSFESEVDILAGL